MTSKPYKNSLQNAPWICLWSPKCWSPKIHFLKPLQRVTTMTNGWHGRDNFLPQNAILLCLSLLWHYSFMVGTLFCVTFPPFFACHDCDTWSSRPWHFFAPLFYQSLHAFVSLLGAFPFWIIFPSFPTCFLQSISSYK